MFFSSMSLQGIAQCFFSFDQEILDTTQVDLSMQISGLDRDDLAIDQGLCAIRLEFRHEYVGDLTIELISPAGQVVTLVGPLTDQINPTNLTVWNVQFTRCDAPAIPDAGFSSSWSNNQQWGVFGSYSGTYYPNMGCLEGFDMGLANGIWTLRVRDEDSDATGLLVSAELEFCDNSGLACTQCAANAGQFASTESELCDPGAIGADMFIAEYEGMGAVPPASDYGYLYTISPNGGNVIVVDQPETFAWQRTSYTVCGISFLSSDSLQLRSQIDTMSQLELQSAFISNQIATCAAITSNCIELTLADVIDTTRINEVVCNGTPVSVGGMLFDQSGEYIVPLASSAGCDSIVKLQLEVDTALPVIRQMDTLTCDVQNTVLSAAESTFSGIAEYQWSTLNGIIEGAQNAQEITIAAPGTYVLELTTLPSGCSATTSLQVETDSSQPFVAIENYELTCANSSIVANALVFQDDLIYNWSGPNGFSSDQESPTLTQPGSYALQVTDPSDGCINSTVFQVDADTIPPELSVSTRKQCSAERVRVASWSRMAVSYRWEGPQNYTTDTRVFFAPAPGTYYVYATGVNGCIAVDSVEVDFDFELPVVSLNSALDSLGCGEETQLFASSSIQGTVFDWSGPGLQVSSVDQITTGVPGNYSITGTAPNGCVASDALEVLPGADRPDILIFSDTITCDVDTATIGVVPSVGVTRYRWTGPSVVDSNLAFVRVTQPGNYFVEITDVNGCESMTSVVVIDDTFEPRFTIHADTLTCNQTSGRLWFVPSSEYSSLEWTNPGGATFTDSMLTIDQPGTYTLEVTGSNGCNRIRNFKIPVDTISPNVFIEDISIGCVDSILLKTLSFDPSHTYEWSGPDGFRDTVAQPFVYEPGQYRVLVRGQNGCQSSITTTVDDNTAPPDIEISIGLFHCIDSIAVLNATSSDTGAVYTWESINGMLSDSSSVTVTEPASYFVAVIGTNQCSARDTVEVQPPISPRIYSSPNSLNCRDDEVQLSAWSDSTGMTYQWFDTAGSVVGIGPTFETNLPGEYRVIGTWINGCASEDTTYVDVDTISPVAIIETQGIVRCASRQLYLSGVMSLGDSLEYSWSTANGEIVFGESSDSVFVRGVGMYDLVVTQATNHCSSSVSYEVVAQPSTLKSFDIDIVPECQDNRAGEIIVQDVLGKDSRLQYSVGGDFQDENVFDSLTLGDYRVTVVDSFGCTLDTVVTVTETSSEVTVSLGPDIRAIVGDEILLEAEIQTPVTEIFWMPVLPCDSCTSNTVTPVETETFTIFIRDEFGCLAQDEIVVFVAERAQVYVPNTFTPNGDGKNDVHMPSFHPGIAKVENYAIYDRWGNLVFSAEDVPPDPSQMTWHGALDGDDLHSAVFTWIMNVVLLTGERETLTGDITLLR